MKKPTITEIIRGQSLSGDAGCTNGELFTYVLVSKPGLTGWNHVSTLK